MVRKPNNMKTLLESEYYSIERCKVIETVKLTEVEFENFPYDIQRIIKGSEEIGYLLRFFKGYRKYY